MLILEAVFQGQPGANIEGLLRPRNLGSICLVNRQMMGGISSGLGANDQRRPSDTVAVRITSPGSTLRTRTARRRSRRDNNLRRADLPTRARARWTFAGADYSEWCHPDS